MKLLVACFSFIFGFAAISSAGQETSRELIQDNHFRRGFILYKPEPGKHVRYGALKGFEEKKKPMWNLLQWGSRFPFDAGLTKSNSRFITYSNVAKAIAIGTFRSKNSDISFAANSAVEYGEHAKKPGEPWIHLLVEQEFEPAALQKIKAAHLHVEARLLRSRNLHQNDYSQDVHAAQFQIFFTVQNRNQKSPGFGDLLWFGVLIYDNRDRFPKEIKFQDFGGTGKFIFAPEGKTFTPNSAQDGNWIVIDKDLLPLMREALETAWSRGFLKGSKQFEDYAIGGMNMGWELPGSFDVEMQVRNLSLKLMEK